MSGTASSFPFSILTQLLTRQDGGQAIWISLAQTACAALTESEPVITAPSSPVAGIAGAGGGALDGGRTWLGLEDK